VVTTLSAFRRLNPAYETESLEWKDSFDVREVLIFNEQLIEKDLCAFAAQARQLPNLTISAGGTIRDRLRRFAYYRRLNTRRR